MCDFFDFLAKTEAPPTIAVLRALWLTERRVLFFSVRHTHSNSRQTRCCLWIPCLEDDVDDDPTEKGADGLLEASDRGTSSRQQGSGGGRPQERQQIKTREVWTAGVDHSFRCAMMLVRNIK